MSVRPIPFTDIMVSALREGQKTQTRRAITSARVFATPDRPAFTLMGDELSRALQNANNFRHFEERAWSWEADAYAWQGHNKRTRWYAHLGYAVGDHLYVRESYYQFGHWEPVQGAKTKGGKQKWGFIADRPDVLFETPENCRLGRHHSDSATPAWHKRLGRFMPRAASRMTLIVTDVRVQCLQDISDDDAEAEGCPPCHVCNGVGWINSGPDGGWQCTAPGCGDAYVDQYKKLWNTINGAGSWEANPWVTATTFTVHHCNVDALHIQQSHWPLGD